MVTHCRKGPWPVWEHPAGDWREARESSAMRDRLSEAEGGASRWHWTITLSLWRQQIHNRHARDLPPSDEKGNRVGSGMIFPLSVGRVWPRTGRVRVHLDLPVYEVDDPVTSDGGAGVHSPFLVTVPGQARVRHLDQHGDF